MSPRKNIIQIAKEAGVAPSTVSRVLNNHPDVSANTYYKVKAVIDRLGFTPNATARSLVSKRSHTLALVTSDLVVYPKLILAVVEAQTRRHGYKLFVNVIDAQQSPPSAQDDRVLEDLAASQVDGIIWAVEEMQPTFELWNQRLRQLDIPVVSISSRFVDSLTFVGVNNRLGGRLATNHLREQGYRRIATITGPLSEIAVSERHAGWEEALVVAGLPAAPTQVVESDWSPAGGERSFLQLYRQSPDTDAVFVQNDQMAVGVLSAIHQLGLKVPEQIGLVGFDNRNESAFLVPPLSSISHHFDRVGSITVEEINRLIQLSPQERAREGPRANWIEPELVVRKSSMRVQEGG